ncbi:trypsin-like peptidase domain-containing protein [Streptomyces sp. NPDC001914]|uniref:VMAP-C domain-containing protein n=1 Tax=Streptomyces sp. NPDC001914 TaxID=3364623 RepID=UPI003679BC93
MRDDKVAGGGLILGPDTVVTCAHVVNDALGRALFEPRAPGLEDITVEFTGPRAHGRYPARVAHWIAPRTHDGATVRAGEDHWLGDLAVLRVNAPEDSVWPATRRLAMTAGQKVRAWHGSTGGATFADLTVKSADGPVAYLDGEATGMAVGPGYSGGPLWCSRDQAVVGVVVAHFMPPQDPLTGGPAGYSPQHLIRRSWGIPWQHIETELRGVGALDLQEVEPADPDDPARLLLIEALEAAFPSPSGRGDAARQLARACGVGDGGEVTPPTFEEFTDFLLSHPRALAAFTEILRRRDSAAADRVLTAGRLSPGPRLLSPREYARLHHLLRGVDRTVLGRFGEVVRAALPLVAVFPGGGSLDTLLDHLETLPGDGRSDGTDPRVPALLRAMEYLSVLCAAPQRAGLRMWSDGVIARLGIPRSALAERRSDAQEWARDIRTRSARARVLVEVRQAGAERHRLRIWCDEGAGPRQVSATADVSYSASEAARELLRTLESVAPSASQGQRPLVEVLVDRGSLNLPVDEWEGRAPDEIVPGVLGVEFPLVMHCPELLRRHERFLPEWRRRWSRLDSGATLVFSDASKDPNQVYYELMEKLDAVRVSVDVPPGLRDGIVQVCLAVGVPVVVWDRGRDTDSHAVRHMARVATRELPDGVRSYRARTMAHPHDFPGRPVLAWADADRTVPRLHLAEPQEGV